VLNTVLYNRKERLGNEVKKRLGNDLRSYIRTISLQTQTQILGENMPVTGLGFLAHIVYGVVLGEHGNISFKKKRLILCHLSIEITTMASLFYVQ
jgi:hypothetical protein